MTTRLKPLGFRIGILRTVVPNGDMMLAQMEVTCARCGIAHDELVEVPAVFEIRLQDLIEKKIVVSRLYEKYYVAEYRLEECPGV